MNYWQTFFPFFPGTTTRGDNLRSIRGWGSHSSINLPTLYSWRDKKRKEIWLRANNLSLHLAYDWAEVKATAFCWITFPLINDTAMGKISPGEWQGESESIMQVCVGANRWRECITVSRLIRHSSKCWGKINKRNKRYKTVRMNYCLICSGAERESRDICMNIFTQEKEANISRSWIPRINRKMLPSSIVSGFHRVALILLQARAKVSLLQSHKQVTLTYCGKK